MLSRLASAAGREHSGTVRVHIVYMSAPTGEDDLFLLEALVLPPLEHIVDPYDRVRRCGREGVRYLGISGITNDSFRGLSPMWCEA